MTSKEKAKELIDKFKNVPLSLYIIPKENEDVFCLSYKEAKQCALITVDEIMQYAENSYYNKDVINGAKLYWQEVKQEIEKL